MTPVVVVLALALVQAADTKPLTPHARYQVGVEKLDQGEMAEALTIYREITRENPYYPWGWMGLGWALHYTGDCRAALPAYQRALDYGGLPPYRVLQEMARCHVALGDADAAIDALRRALALGFPSSERLRTDNRLEALHALPAFKALFAPAVTTPPAATREIGWGDDLDLLAREIARIHYSARRAFAPGELEASIQAIKERVPASSDDEVTVEVMRLLRRLGDGHTYAEPRYMQRGESFAALPLQFEQFADGIFVTAVLPGHDAELWSEVIAVNGRAIGDVMEVLSAISPQDNLWRPRAVAPDYLRHPQLLRALGIGDDGDRASVTLRAADGATRVAVIATRAGVHAGWIRHGAATGPQPASFSRRFDWYWFEALGDDTIFVQYNACGNKEDESVEAFSTRLSAALADPAIKRLIVDLRWNGGGNNFVNRPLLDAITRAPQNRDGQLFVVIGPSTFSAAMIFTAQLERYTKAIFVGEPTGSSPNFVGETTFVTLPHSKLRVSLSNLYWQTSHATDFRQWIPPLVYVPSRFEEYRAGRDAALEAVLGYPAG